jgi:hypothetical protein
MISTVELKINLLSWLICKQLQQATARTLYVKSICWLICKQLQQATARTLGVKSCYCWCRQVKTLLVIILY